MKNESKSVSYFERINILSTSVNHIKQIIKKHITNTMKAWEDGLDIEKQTFHIIGPAGIGKTDICKQLSIELTEELNKEFHIIKIQSPVISRDDILCPFPEIKGDDKKFSMLFSDFIPVEKDSYGIFVIDEFSRGDHNLQQLMWQIQNENMIHTKPFPKGWFIISLDNPDDEAYSMNNLEDAAGIRRCCHIYAEVSVSAFLTYAKKKNFHHCVVEYIESHTGHLYDFESQKLGRVYANPASWERVSNILIGYENIEKNGNGIFSNLTEIELIISGLLNASSTRLFIDFIRSSENIKPEEVFKNYKNIRPKVMKYRKELNNTQLSRLMIDVMDYILNIRPEVKSENIDNIKSFLVDLPEDIGATYFVIAHEARDKNIEGFRHLSFIQKGMLNDEEFNKKFVEPMLKSSKEKNSANTR